MRLKVKILVHSGAPTYFFRVFSSLHAHSCWPCSDKTRFCVEHINTLGKKEKFKVQSSGAASRGPLWRRESRSLGTKWKPKNVEFWPFIDPSGQNQLYHTPLLSKIWDLNNGKKLVNNPFKAYYTSHGGQPWSVLNSCIEADLYSGDVHLGPVVKGHVDRNTVKIWFAHN